MAVVAILVAVAAALDEIIIINCSDGHSVGAGELDEILLLI
jgi:hypothetical protein